MQTYAPDYFYSVDIEKHSSSQFIITGTQNGTVLFLLSENLQLFKKFPQTHQYPVLFTKWMKNSTNLALTVSKEKII